MDSAVDLFDLFVRWRSIDANELNLVSLVGDVFDLLLRQRSSGANESPPAEPESGSLHHPGDADASKRPCEGGAVLA